MEERAHGVIFFVPFSWYMTTTGLCLQLTQTTNGGANGDGSGGGGSVSTTGGHLVATRARPDSDVSTLNGVLTAELASVLRVLRNFDLLDLLTDGRTITGSVLSDDSDLLGSATLHFHRPSFKSIFKIIFSQG
jgi:hypothetical protein